MQNLEVYSSSMTNNNSEYEFCNSAYNEINAE
jgi:hypothetical protein